jgi:CubicO group peptidase (beta-lactamase class C family)
MEVIMNKSRLSSKWLWFAMVVAALVLSLSAGDDITDKVDKIFAQWDTTTTPGCALAVVKDGRIIYKRGYGMAKLEDNLVMTPDKIFDIGSVSKQFTATCIAMLVRDGKISLADDIRKYFPDLPQYGRPITVQHLIHHTSGLRDYNGLLELAGFRPESDCPNVDEALEIVFRQKELNYPTGDEYSYTNTGYFLLGQIVEKVSGKSLNRFAQERIFEPLGMSHTLYQDDHRQIIKNRATGYTQAEKGYRLNMSNWDETGDGNIYTSVEDLFLWDQAFYNNKLGQDLMEMLHTAGVLNNGTKLDYGFGLIFRDYKGLKNVGHDGAWAGFTAAISRFPEQKFSVICLANLDSINPADLCSKVADIYLIDLFKEPTKVEAEKPKPFPLSPKELEGKAGNYRDERFGQWIAVSVDKDKLKAAGFRGGREFVFTPIGPSSFVALEAPFPITLDFPPVEKGRPTTAVFKGRDGATKFTKAAPVKPLTEAQLGGFSGIYASQELLGASYRLDIENGNLVVNFRSIPSTQLKAMAPDQFSAGFFNLDFVRDKGNKISGFNLSMGRVADIVFTKK